MEVWGNTHDWCGLGTAIDWVSQLGLGYGIRRAVYLLSFGEGLYHTASFIIIVFCCLSI